MQAHVSGARSQTLVTSQLVGRSLTVADVCLCLVPIGLFLSIMSMV